MVEDAGSPNPPAESKSATAIQQLDAREFGPATSLHCIHIMIHVIFLGLQNVPFLFFISPFPSEKALGPPAGYGRIVAGIH